MSVTMLTTPSCSNCHLIKQLLSIRGVGIEEVNITEDEVTYNELTGAGTKSVPVFVLEKEESDKVKKALTDINRLMTDVHKITLEKIDVELERFSGKVVHGFKAI